MLTILVTGAGALLGQGIVRALQTSSLETRIIMVDPSPLSAGLYWGDRGYVIERADSPKYIDRLTEVIVAERPDIVLVGTDVELAVLAEHRQRLEESCNTKILVSDPRAVAIANDKYLTYEFFKDMGGNPPESALPEDRAAIDRLVEAVGFPLIVKPRVGARSIGVSKVANVAELDAAIMGREGLVVQECVGADSAEYTAGVIVFEGEAMAAIVMRRDLRDGNTYRAYVDDFPALREATLRFGEGLRPFGPANFQFRLDDQGRPRVFEINCRFSGTTPLRALAGFNEVEMCIRRVLTGARVVQPEIKQVTILRHWSETVITAADMDALG